MTNKQNKLEKQLITKSNSGCFSASAQLAEIYENGYYDIIVNKELAEIYKKKIATQLTDVEFKLHSLKLINYRGFEEIEIPFKSKTTLLIGNNGSGKSSVLDAIQKTLTHFVSRLITKSYNGEQIDELDININHDYSTVIPTFKIGNSYLSYELTQSKSLIEPKKKSKFKDLNDIGILYRTANTYDKNLSLPLLASYTVERANDVTTRDIESSEEITNIQEWNKSKAYSKSLNGKADFKLFFRWFKEQIDNENDDDALLKVIKTKIEAKKSDLDGDVIKELKKDPTNSHIADIFIERYKKEIKELEDELNSKTNIDNKSLDSVRNAIYQFLPGFTNLKLKRRPLDLLISKNGEEFSVLQLSQGEKSILSLVADIARRLTLLNPSSENPLNGKGLILIDEIDLHLHPSWQQKVIQRLENTFPNLQFIMTTHSPQVCHTVDSENIWLLKDGDKIKAPKGVRGAVSSWVLKNLFEVEIRPPEDDITLSLNKYKELVYADKYHSTKALKIRNKLTSHFGSSYEDLVELDMYIENKEWEKELEEDK
ncbi:retron Ec78 anti-phage system effector ATPase PtuA [Photobacterium kishitanii]|uniref:retron Ec78 anti-phage system effector ATPase PtuA n=1 Tax=Photobacterium kishitanii TaxID=318456 RepID=UPI000D169544|nr:retron Ec78 anti-phage system effector ATPase PtuA [Photobacterium kishitanii]PSV25491.1 recombinase RecF [Photobacterium kishitanii]